MSLSTAVAVVAVLVLLYLAIRSRGAHDCRPAGGAGRCPTGKVLFPSRSEADRVVRRSQSDRGSGYDRPLQRSYRCPHCGSWHTTSQRKRAHW